MNYTESNEHDVLAINNKSTDDWRRPIMEYLENPIGTIDRKVKYRTLSYIITRKELFKNTP